MKGKTHIFWLVAAALVFLAPQCGPAVPEPDPVDPGEPESRKYLNLSLSSKEVDNDSGTFEVNVTTNGAWSASSDADWLEPSKTSAQRGEVITVRYKANPGLGQRSGKLTFTVAGLDPKILNVRQSGKFLAFFPTELEIDNAGGDVSFTVSANCGWTVSSDASWLTPLKTGSKSSETVTVQCAANPTPSTRRSGTLRVRSEGLEDKLVTITQGVTFTNPIGGVPDPYIVKDGNAYYLCKAATGINVSRSDHLSHLNGTREVWRPDINSPTDWNTSHIWAPEMHKIRGNWYIYYTAGRPSSESGGSYKMQRSGVLRAKTEDPEGAWEDMGMLYTGDNYTPGIVATAANTRYAIDLTVFELRGQLYAVWSGAAGPNDSNQSIYIATMSDPCTISCSRIRLSGAELPWERQSSQIQEGPAILRHAGKLFIVYSCNGSWTKHYRLGYLVMDESSDPLVPASWTKSPDQVFYRCDDTADRDGVNGVGHCTFTVSPDGSEDWIVYHAKNRNDNTYTTGRSTYLKRFTWREDGMPDFGTPVGYGERNLVPSGE